MDKPIKRSCFITVEGIEGVGKSTHMSYICDLLAKHDIDVLRTREPGGTTIAENIRQLLLHHENEEVTPQTELLLLFAARSQHLAHVIKPALMQGKWVVCDRFTDTTYAYQGGGRKLSFEEIALLEKEVQEGLKPDLVLLLDAPVSLAMSRAGGRGKPDRIEREQGEFFERVRQVFLQRAKLFPDIYRVINAAHSLEDVQSQLQTTLEAFIATRNAHA